MKKRLAFSCAGEGFGHIARVVALSESLKERFDLIYFVPKSVQQFLFDHLGDVPFVTIPSYHFVLKNHGVDYCKTVKQNLPHMINYNKIKEDLKGQLKDHGIDALICDFEPFVSRAASEMGIPLLNLNHPGIVLKTFSLSLSGTLSRIVATYMTPSAQDTLFCSFFNGEVGPIIRKEIREKEPVKENFFVVYTKKDSRKQILKALKDYPELNFEIFPGKSGDFADALSRCKGVIAPAGHQLLSEALFLRKPVLAFPQKNQYEQKINARMLEKSGYGIYGRKNRMNSDMTRFFKNVDKMPFKANKFQRFKFNDDTEFIVDYITAFVDEQTAGRPKKRSKYTYLNSIYERISTVNNYYSDQLHA